MCDALFASAAAFSSTSSRVSFKCRCLMRSWMAKDSAAETARTVLSALTSLDVGLGTMCRFRIIKAVCDTGSATGSAACDSVSRAAVRRATWAASPDRATSSICTSMGPLLSATLLRVTSQGRSTSSACASFSSEGIEGSRLTWRSRCCACRRSASAAAAAVDADAASPAPPVSPARAGAALAAPVAAAAASCRVGASCPSTVLDAGCTLGTEDRMVSGGCAAAPALQACARCAAASSAARRRACSLSTLLRMRLPPSGRRARRSGLPSRSRAPFRSSWSSWYSSVSGGGCDPIVSLCGKPVPAMKYRYCS
eukprot:Rhum_TRINITY_DN15294_c3_g6::Rhum_TRINITY_DN15294_c3_g6_i1::g.148589::m.148589